MELINNIALISIYPPPFGGVSIHAKTLANELMNRKMLNVLITGGKRNKDDPNYIKRISSLKIFNVFIFWHYKIPFYLSLYSKKIKIIHSHEGFSSVPFLFIHRFILKKQIIHTIHNQWPIKQYNSQNIIKRIIIKLFLKDKNTIWICVNENALAQMLKLGIKKECGFIIPAYISQHKKTIVSNPNDLKIISTIKEFRQYDKLIGVYGFKFSFDLIRQDIYGFNFAIDVFKQLLKVKPCFKLVILIPNATPHAQKQDFQQRIKNEGLTDHILTIFDDPIINMNLFWNLLDIYFRPTTDDGDSISIREALANGIPVVASDVCKRPGKSITFKSMDIQNALEKLIAINEKERPVEEDQNYLPEIINIYYSCCMVPISAHHK